VFDIEAKRARLTKLFEFLKAYIDLRHPPVRDIDEQFRTIWLKDLPKHTSVELFRDVSTTNNEDEDADILLRLKRPTITSPPLPPASISPWLKPGWREFSGQVEILDSRNVVGKDGKTQVERFENDIQLEPQLRKWKLEREKWLVNERPARQSMALFETVYEWWGALQREGNKIELLVGDGLVKCKEDTGNFSHPVLLQKLELEFDPEKRAPVFIIRKRETPPELYLEFLRILPGADLQQLARCADELKKAEFTPLAGC
jgi:hypothetical protein